ncbi:MAG: FtsW/RodA/SpoVE family cell cycle protein [Rothia sp. (in: high G+C Gram-positive bacteria)]|nr:FtsW/RodA/SpoVE family cell cycle protein [Rothia sp. (in: high G+C Gram-positive bacteria)]
MTELAQQPQKKTSRLALNRTWLRSNWENAQVRFGTMVLTDLPLVLTVTAVVLTLFGVIMVLSASSVEQISAGAGPLSQVKSQGIFALLGLGLMGLVGYLLPVSWYRKPLVLNLLMLAALGLLVAVIFVGKEVNGNRNWISIAGFTLQPSEFAKPLMILWLASVYSRQGRIDQGTRAQTVYKGLMPALLGFGAAVALILAGHDVGTVLVYGLIFASIFWVARPSSFLLLLAGLGAALGGALMVMVSPNRIERLLNTWVFWEECLEATCDQANSGLAALATGGFWGVGLGQSRQKYNYLPEAHNDYIFAVVGEELGLVGALMVLALYAALVYACMRILLRSADLFIRFATVGIMAWLIGQASLNIGMVVGLLPVIGVPLPFISAGGSALISSLVGVGILIAFARQTPMTALVGEVGSLTQPQQEKDAARRLALGRLVAQEQQQLAEAGEQAGWTLEKFRQRLGAVIDGRGSSAAAQPAAQRPAPLQAEPLQPAVQPKPVPEPKPAVQPKPVPEPKPAAQPKPVPQPAAQPKPARAGKGAEEKLPAGLKTIHKARPLPTLPPEK